MTQKARRGESLARASLAVREWERLLRRTRRLMARTKSAPRKGHWRVDTLLFVVAERPSPVQALIDRLSTVLVRSGRLQGVWTAAEARASRPSGFLDGFWERYVPPDAGSGDAEPKADRDARRSRLHRLDAGAANCADQLTVAVQLWRPAIDAAIEAVSAVAEWTDREHDPAGDRWTAGARSDLRSLRGLIPELSAGDFPHLGSGVPPELTIHTDAVKARMKYLKSIVEQSSIATPPPLTIRDGASSRGVEPSGAGREPVIGATNAALQMAADRLEALANWVPALFQRREGDWLWHVKRDDWSRGIRVEELTTQSWAAVKAIDGAIRALGITDSRGMPEPDGFTGVWQDWSDPIYPISHRGLAESVLALGIEIHGWHSRLSRMPFETPDGLEHRISADTGVWARGCANRARALAEDQPARERARGLQTADQTEPAASSGGPFQWLTVSEAHTASGLPTYEISRLCTSQRLRTNGKTGRERRIDASSLIELKLAIAKDVTLKRLRRWLAGSTGQRRSR
jgi:hypothetical protein